MSVYVLPDPGQEGLDPGVHARLAVTAQLAAVADDADQVPGVGVSSVTSVLGENARIVTLHTWRLPGCRVPRQSHHCTSPCPALPRRTPGDRQDTTEKIPLNYLTLNWAQNIKQEG